MNPIEKKYWDAFHTFMIMDRDFQIYHNTDGIVIPLNFKLENIIDNENLEMYSKDDLEQIRKILNTKEFSFSVTPSFEYDNFYYRYDINNTFYLSNANDFEIKIGAYTPDFVIEYLNFKYAIEIDGHEFHGKTKEQVISDKKKEREYIRLGYIPIRFSGSEVYKDDIGCVEETLKTVLSNAAKRIADEKFYTSMGYELGYANALVKKENKNDN